MFNLFNTAPFLAPVIDTSPRTTATSITVTGRVPSGSVVTGFIVSWQRNTSVGCPVTDQGSTRVVGGFTSFTIIELEEDSRYTVSVRPFNEVGRGPRNNIVTAMTQEAGGCSLLHSLTPVLAVHLLAPSAAPASVTMEVTVFHIMRVWWGPVDCRHRNGEITGYAVRYGEKGSSEGDRTVLMVSSGNSSGRTTIITGLAPATLYVVQVAAVNSAGTGVYSSATFVDTKGNNKCAPRCCCFYFFYFLPRTVVGLDARVYTVSESDRAVEICVTASTGNAQRCPYVQPFQVNLATTGKTAGYNNSGTSE